MLRAAETNPSMPQGAELVVIGLFILVPLIVLALVVVLVRRSRRG